MVVVVKEDPDRRWQVLEGVVLMVLVSEEGLDLRSPVATLCSSGK